MRWFSGKKKIINEEGINSLPIIGGFNSMGRNLRCMAKILIIDDDHDVCRLLGQFLGQQGYEVASAGDGSDGLTAAAAFNPDLIICDLDMPELNGQGVITALRQDRRLSEVPVIVFSGSTDRDQIRGSINSGGDDYLAKPPNLPELLNAINARLARRQKQVRQLDQQIEQAAQVFVGIIHDLNKMSPAVHWLADTGDGTAEQQNTIIQRVRRSLAAGQPSAGKPVPAPSDSLLINTNQRQQLLKLSEVKALLADGDYSNVYWGRGQRMMFRKPLKQWETELPPGQFFRAHRQAIINLSHLDFVEKAKAGKLRIHLREFQEVIPVSQRNTAAFNRCLKAFKAR